MKYCDIKAIAFDLDGTIYFGEKIADGALNLIDRLGKYGIETFYFTNNSTQTRYHIYQKLSRLGINVNLEKVYNCAYAAAIFLKQQGYDKVFVIGMKGLVEEIKMAGIQVVDNSDDADVLLIGLDTEFSYKKLTEVLHALMKNKKLIACNIDNNYPVEGGLLMPGCGPIAAAIETASDKIIDYIVGKPNTFMLELMANDWKIHPSELIVVGDTYTSDIEMAKSYGCKSVLISKDNSKNFVDTITVDSLCRLELILGII